MVREMDRRLFSDLHRLAANIEQTTVRGDETIKGSQLLTEYCCGDQGLDGVSPCMSSANGETHNRNNDNELPPD